ncbi:hypothetical protein Tco_0016214 [Tanacetum coccineum]
MFPVLIPHGSKDNNKLQASSVAQNPHFQQVEGCCQSEEQNSLGVFKEEVMCIEGSLDLKSENKQMPS